MRDDENEQASTQNGEQTQHHQDSIETIEKARGLIDRLEDDELDGLRRFWR